MESKRNTLGGRAKMTGIGRIVCLHLLVLTAALALLAAQATSAAETQIPEQAKALHAKLATALKPAVRGWISQEAKKVSKDSKASEAEIKADIQSRFAGQSLAGADVEALAFIVLMEASQDAENDLKTIMDGVKLINNQKAAQRQAASKLNQEEAAKQSAGQPNARPVATNLQVRTGAVVSGKNAQASAASPSAKQDSMSDMSQEQQLSMQMAMDRRSKMEEMLSNVLKKISETESNIIGNLK